MCGVDRSIRVGNMYITVSSPAGEDVEVFVSDCDGVCGQCNCWYGVGMVGSVQSGILGCMCCMFDGV